MAKLVAVNQELDGLAHELGEGWTTLGRADGNAFKITDASVSGQHCEVRPRGDELDVRDLCSTNGTFVQGRKIIEAVVKVGQTLRLGEVTLRFEASAASTPRAAPAPFVNTMLVKHGHLKPLPADAATTAAPPKTGPSKKQQQVLFVDDSLAFIETFTELCAVFAKQSWQIHCATSSDQALAILQNVPVDLVVLDIIMPMVDGIQLMGLIKRRYPAVRIAVLTGKTTEGHRSAALAGGAELYIEKPLSPDGSKAIFNMLQDLVSWECPEGFSGTLHQVGLPEVIQMQCIGRRSLILEVRNHQVLGEIYIEVGSITHAAVGELDGPRAINHLLSLNGGEFRVKPFESPQKRTVDAPWEFLLMEAARCCDEDTALLRKEEVNHHTDKQPAAPDSDRQPAQPPAADRQFDQPDEEFVVVATYDGQWSRVQGQQN
jgi:CheY-like chemotaxis protein